MNNNNPSLLSSALEGKKQYTVYQCKRMSVPIVVHHDGFGKGSGSLSMLLKTPSKIKRNNSFFIITLLILYIMSHNS